MNLDTLCLHCMDNDSGERTCPNCGSPFGINAASPQQLVPRTLLHGQYLIGRVLRQGSFGISYLAWDTMMDTKVVVNEYMPEGIAERSAGQTTVRPISPACQEQYEFGLDCFLEEARSLKKLGRNPGIVSVETMFRDNRTAYLVTEFLDGTSLEAFLDRRERTMSFESAQRILVPAMDALVSVHNEGGVHGALSPASFFLSKSGKVKLVGFGVARQALAKKTRNQSLLKEGYAPEEQYRPSGVQGPSTDVYGMAATFYRAITGKVPPPALDRLAEDQLVPPSQLGVSMPPVAEKALMKALAVRAAERFLSIDEFRSALTGAGTAGVANVAGVALPPPPAQAAVPLPASTKAKLAGLFTMPALLAGRLRRPKRLALAVIIALAVIATATATLHHGNDSDQPADDPQATNQQDPTDQTAAQTDQQAQQDDQQQKPDPAGQQPDDGQADQQDQQDQQPEPAPAPPPARIIRPAVALPVAPPPAVVAPVASPVPPAIAPAPAVVAPVAPVVVTGYDPLIAKAETLIQSGDYPGAANLLTRAIAANPARWQAYNELGKVQLYYLNQPGEALANYRAAIAHGGHASFRVRHDHAAEQLGGACSGWLNVSHGSASFVADDGVHTFPSTHVKEAKKNRLIGKILGAEGGHSFHVRLMNNENFNFVPTSNAPKAETDFIVSAIEG